MFAQNLLFRLRHSLFDARDAIIVGLALFTGGLVLLPHSPTLAHVSYSGPLQPGQSEMSQLASAPKSLFSTDLRRRLYGLYNATPTTGTRSNELARTAALTGLTLPARNPVKTENAGTSGKKTCTGLVAINPDGSTKVISPCVESILSGNFENLPERATGFFIDTMNDPEKRKNMPKMAINSFMAMLEAMSKSVEAEEKAEAAAAAKLKAQ